MHDLQDGVTFNYGNWEYVRQYWQDPRPHISIAWAAGDISNSLKRAVTEEIKRHAAVGDSLQKRIFTCVFGGISCKIGNKAYEICKVQEEWVQNILHSALWSNANGYALMFCWFSWRKGFEMRILHETCDLPSEGFGWSYLIFKCITFGKPFIALGLILYIIFEYGIYRKGLGSSLPDSRPALSTGHVRAGKGSTH